MAYDENIESSGFDLISDPKQIEDIGSYLQEEIHDVTTGSERAEFLERVDLWRRHREGQPESRTKDFPWPGASNVVPPLAMINTNGIYSKYRQSMTMRRPFWKISSTNDSLEVRNQAKAAQKFIDALVESKYHINIRKVLRPILYDLVSLGTQYVKVPWVTENKIVYRKGSTGYEPVQQVMVDSPKIIPIRIEDLLTRSFWVDPQKAPWIGHRYYLYDYELKEREANGIFQNVDEILVSGEAEMDENRAEELRRQGINPQYVMKSMYEMVEVYMYTQIDGYTVDIKVWFNPASGQVARIESNELGVRDIGRLGYFDRPYNIYGMGIGWIMEHLQQEAETLHNTRINGLIISLYQMYVTRRGALPPGERFRPMKNIQVDDPKSDFMPIKFPDIGMSSFQAEMMTKEYGDRATGASDYMLGFENRSISTRATASGTQFLAAQNQSVLEGNLEGVEEDFATLGQIVFFQCVRNKEKAMEIATNLLDESLLPDLDAALSVDMVNIPQYFSFQTNTTEVDESEDSRRANMLTLVQLFIQYGEKILQLLMLLSSEQAQQLSPEAKYVALKTYVGATNMLKDIVEGFGNTDPERFLPYVRNIELMLGAMERERDQAASMMEEAERVRENGREMGAAAGGGGPTGQAVQEPGLGTGERAF